MAMTVGVSVRVWSAGVRRDREIRRAARFVAWALADWPGFGRGGCRATDAEIADELGMAENTVKNALLQLRARGHIDWTWRTSRGQAIRTLGPTPASEQRSTPQAAMTAAPTVGADADPEPALSEPSNRELEEVAMKAVAARKVAARRKPSRDDSRSRAASPPFSERRRGQQRSHVQRLIDRLPGFGWYARCSESGCEARAAFICADEGRTFCRPHRRYASHSVALAAFGIGPEDWAGRPQCDGDFRGW
jgi:hypothetical protein